jgi:hypothetical protein
VHSLYCTVICNFVLLSPSPVTLFCTVPCSPIHLLSPGIIGALDPYTHKINTASLYDVFPVPSPPPPTPTHTHATPPPSGIIGALDPYTHKINTASLSGEGKLELEGVRPMRNNQTAAANIAASIISGAD